MFKPFHRRAMLTALATLTMGLAYGAATAQTQVANYPNQTVRFIVPFAAGATTDTLARRIAMNLSEAWKVPVIVQNRPGAGGSIATGDVIRSAADGHTLLMHTASVLQYPHMHQKRLYEVSGLQPLTPVVRGQLVLAIQKDIPAHTLEEFVALTKAQPAKYNYGSYGVGTTPHIQGTVFAEQAGAQWVHVPYQGSAPLVQALRSKEVTSAMLDVVAADVLKDNVRVLAVTGPERWHTLPDVPTFNELGYERLDTRGWIGTFMPAGVPANIAQHVAEQINFALQDQAIIDQIEAMGLTVYASSPQEFQHIVDADYALFGDIIRETGIRLD